MVNRKNQIKIESDVQIPFRRRGRPAGKNRVPLSREERRARNAQYERERRNETAEVMSQLAEAVGCDPNITNADLLATVVSRLERASRRKPFENIAELEHINANLESQIATLQSRLGLDDEAFEKLDAESNILPTQFDDNNDNESIDFVQGSRCPRKINNKRKRTERQSIENIQTEKRIKSQSETWSDHDSGIELRSHTRSPPDLCAQLMIKTESEQSDSAPLETIEEHYHEENDANVKIETELYNEIYNPHPQGPSGLPMSNQDSMAVLTRSLTTVPSIVPPQGQPESYTTPDWSESIGERNEESHQDFELEDKINHISPQAQSIFVYLTDTEKVLINDWIGDEYLQANEFNNEMQADMRNYGSYGVFSGN